MSDTKKNNNPNISDPVLYSNKAFSPSREKKKFYKNLQNTQAITTENLIPSLQAEAQSEEITEKLISSSYQAVEKQRSKKKRWLSFAFLMINFAILIAILIWQFSNEEPVSIADLINSKINWWWLAIGILLFFMINALDSFRISLGIKKATGRFRPILSFKSVVTCRFYDNITPLATGGQPFQIYYLNKRGINASTATSIPLSKYIYSQVTAVLFCIVILIVNSYLHIATNPTLLTLAWVGLLLNLLLIGAVFSLSVSKKVAPKITISLLKLCYRLHFIKDYKATYRKIMRIVQEYTMTFKEFMKSGWLALWQLLISLLFLFAINTIPFVVYCIFNPYNPAVWFDLFVLQVICDLALCFIPIPGGAGGAELSFAVLFRSYFETTQGIFVWAMLFWRFFTYYAYLLQGALLLLYDFLIGNRRIGPLLQKYADEDKKRSDLNQILEHYNKRNKKGGKTK